MSVSTTDASIESLERAMAERMKLSGGGGGGDERQEEGRTGRWTDGQVEDEKRGQEKKKKEEEEKEEERRQDGEEDDSLRDASPDPNEPISKGKPSSCRGALASEAVRKRLKEIVVQRRPVEYSVDPLTLNNPLHRLLNDSSSSKAPDHLAQTLSDLLEGMKGAGFLNAFVNMANKLGRTPLSLSLRSPHLACCLKPLIAYGAQVHHLCGELSERCNHMHYAAIKSAPETIDALLTAMMEFNQLDALHAVNARQLTPKSELQRRRSACWCTMPLEADKLSGILDRLRGASPPDMDEFVAEGGNLGFGSVPTYC